MVWFPLIAFLVSFLGIYLLKKYALQLNLVAIPNERSLHNKVIPRGGGVIIAIIFLAFNLVFYISGQMKTAEFLALFGGGLIMSVTGFLDDILELKASIRFLIQFLAVGWGLYWVGGIPSIAFFEGLSGLYVIANGIAVVVLVWFINAFNFMDGIDGMATSGATFFSLSVGGYFLWQGIEPYGSLLIILAACSLAFLYFNWPPAKMFLGDSGSTFFGYFFGVILIITVKNSSLSIWTWLIILAYFITDTTTTTFLRLCLVKRWYLPHRSHAYQNLARVLDNHKFVTSLITGINVFYLLPLAYLSIEYQQYGWLGFLASVIPIFVFVLRYGPLYAR
ncbi:MAG: glycosyltransferase family 4 protein [Candidatus Magasanikbacteria bacterium]|nr:glycosyltransferase family 4 protein [Candidatus Magasanikbacteria bacterium]